MALPDREGRFKATIVQSVVKETGPNNLLTFKARYSLTDWWDGAAWIPWSEYCAEIEAYHYLTKRDGQLNLHTIESLCASLGWNRDVAALDDTDWSHTPVQVTLASEEYQGKSRLKVQFLNPIDYEGASDFTKAAPDERRAIVNKYCAMFRTLGGGAPASKPAPQTKPTAPPPSRSAPSRHAPSTSTSTKELVAKNRDEAWAFVVGEYKYDALPTVKQEEIQTHFLNTIEKVAKRCGRPSEDAMVPEDWSDVAEEAAIPF